NRGSVAAEHVVLATAGYTPALGILRGRLLPLHLQVVATEPLTDQQLQLLRWQGREGLVDVRLVFSYARLTVDNRIVFGGGRPRYRWGGQADDGPESYAALDALQTELQQTFPREADLRVTGGWTGVIDYTLDGLPAIHR